MQFTADFDSSVIVFNWRIHLDYTHSNIFSLHEYTMRNSRIEEEKTLGLVKRLFYIAMQAGGFSLSHQIFRQETWTGDKRDPSGRLHISV